MTEEKILFLIVPGAEEMEKLRHIVVLPGATPRDVLQAFGLEDLDLINSNGEKLDSEADLFNEVEEGEQLYAIRMSCCVGYQGSSTISSSSAEDEKDEQEVKNWQKEKK